MAALAGAMDHMVLKVAEIKTVDTILLCAILVVTAEAKMMVFSAWVAASETVEVTLVSLASGAMQPTVANMLLLCAV